MNRTGWRELGGVLLLVAGIVLLLAVATYDSGDVALLNYPPPDHLDNLIGPFGATAAFSCFTAFGVAGFTVPVLIMVLGLILITHRGRRVWDKTIWLIVLQVSLACMVDMHPTWWGNLQETLNLPSIGGMVGYLLGTQVLLAYIGPLGAGVTVAGMAIISLAFLLRQGPLRLLQGLGHGIGWLGEQVADRIPHEGEPDIDLDREARDLERKRRELEKQLENKKDKVPKKTRLRPVRESTAEPKEKPAPKKTPARKTPVKRKPAKQKTHSTDTAIQWDNGNFSLPPMSMLNPLPPASERKIEGDFKANARVLEDTLSEFGIDAKVVNIETGPVVTSYEVLPAPGIRVERIVGLSNNIALAMKAISVRVQAPIPGRGVVGIEVPNNKSLAVYLREVLESKAWTESNAALPLALGMDVGGKEIVTDLAKMPHLLIAGATGSGKSVCMNSILAGLLMSRTPDQMRLMLVDPKMVEFAFFNDLPHLVVPVITDPKKVSLGLRWAINEMEKRYKLFARVGVRNIATYNQRPVAQQDELFTGEVGPGTTDLKGTPPARLPYIVIVIDELADLMMVAQAEVEGSIARLAQLSRAVGIHMILATQRPSVNVITGTIKANFPTRIAFQVAQGNDSRTILDTVGAEKLLGRGDMLFLPPGVGKLQRAQGTMTEDEEIRDVVDFWKEQGQPRYELAIKEKIESDKPELPDNSNQKDELMDQAVEVIRQTNRASTSSLQRRLRIGYTRAARLMDMLEEQGVIGPPNGSDPREILVDLDGEIPANEDSATDEDPG